MAIRRCAESLLIVMGLALCGFYALTSLHSALASRLLIATFSVSAASQDASPQKPAVAMSTPSAVDFSGWSVARITGYKKALAAMVSPPLAILTIPKIGLEVPVLEGIDTVTLDRGAGRIPGTASLGESGNVGIAGHRDGFFRGLKDIATGDTIILSTLSGRSTYTVDSIRIVNPADVQVLDPRPLPSLTLVTCYPFYFIGAAPRRFIVQASLKEAQEPAPGGAPNTRTVN